MLFFSNVYLLTISFVLDVITYIEKQIETGDIKEDTRVIREKIKVLKNIDENTKVTREVGEFLLEKVEMLTEVVLQSNDANLQVPIPGELYVIGSVLYWMWWWMQEV